MFWKFEVHTTSKVETLLEKEDVTLIELLDEDDVLQECKAQNKKLIDFMVQTDIIEELVRLITENPTDDAEESAQYKHPNMACEVLTSDVAAISDKLADTEVSMIHQYKLPNVACEVLTSDVAAISDKLADSEPALSKLWGFLDGDPPLNPLLASFVSKTVGSLLARRPEVVVQHMKSKEDSIGVLLNHLGTSAMMDLILRLITCIESPEVRLNLLQWMNENKFIERLADLIDPETTEDKHSNAAQTLCDIIRLTREHMSQLQEIAECDPLLSTLEKEDTVSELLDHMFHGDKCESALVNGISVLLSLLEFKKQGPEGQEQMTALDAERLARGVSGTLKAVVPKLADLHQLLTEPPKLPAMPTTVGKLEPPFGGTRLQVAKLVAALLVTNSEDINAELARLGTIKSLLELFFQYMWNNFLHLEVEKCISTILANNPIESEEGKEQHPLLVHLFTECRLIQRILESWDENEQSQLQQGSRRGYMGHLTRIANTVHHEQEKGCNSEQIKSLIQEYVPEEFREKWNTFLSGGLADMNKKNQVDLVGTHPLHSSSEDDDADFRDLDFGRDSQLQQFGFNEEEFAEQEEGVNNPFDRISDINFSISANEDNPNSALFEACCNERIQQFNDSNSDEEDMWEEKELTYTSTTESRPSNAAAEVGSDQSNDSSDSEEEETSGPLQVRSAPEKPSSNPAPGPSASIASAAVSTSSEEPAKMDVDTSDLLTPSTAWPNNFDDVPMDSAVAMDTTPTAWEQQPVSSSAEEDTGWANFSDFNSGFMNTGDEGPRSRSPVAMESESSPSPSPASNVATACQSNSPSRPGAAYVVSSESSSEDPAKTDRTCENTVSSSETDTSNEVNAVNNVERAMEEEEPSSRPSSSPSPVSHTNSNDAASSLGHNSSLDTASSSPAKQTQAEPDSSGTVWDNDSNANPCSPSGPAAVVVETEGNEACPVPPPAVSQPNCTDNTVSAMHHGLVNDAGPAVSPPSPQQGDIVVNSPVDSSSTSSPASPPMVGGSGDDEHKLGDAGLLSNAPAASTDSSSSPSLGVHHNEDIVNEIDRKDIDSHSSSQDVVRHRDEVQQEGVNEEVVEDDDNFDFLTRGGLMKSPSPPHGPHSPRPNGPPSEIDLVEKARAEALEALNQFTTATGRNGPI
ncbi:serine/threonine-protein phosphatase 6 regulatory subunit 3-A-like isoform X3 [Amphiura filiformis]|uniref:serine/threonine-protein phosphatase 6 regulatory subunit 3-A-like isoform X3 n=1 Tax=Amphiura filiformis TaxID=82378 RepID=UPI003B21E2C7